MTPTDAKLCERYRAGDREAGGLLVTWHTGLVRAVIKARHPVPAQVEFDDLRQVGRLAILNAAVGYDPGRGIKFCTYAYWAVKNAVGDEVTGTGKLLAKFAVTAVEKLDRRATAERDAADLLTATYAALDTHPRLNGRCCACCTGWTGNSRSRNSTGRVADRDGWKSGCGSG